MDTNTPIKINADYIYFDKDGNIQLMSFKKTEPDENNLYECPICNKTFARKYYWKDHVKDHQRLKHKCTICDSSFAHHHHLNQHMIIHDEPKHECDICGKKMKYKFNITTHRKTHIKYINSDGKVCYL
jgi:uncharacterized Zn-finger protein